MSVRSAALLTGLPGRDGFVYHDGHNQPVHRAAPGLLGLIEGRLVMERWRPEIVRWLDDTEHFFSHILAELADEPSFDAVRPQIEAIRALDAPATAKSRFLFQQLNELAGGLERQQMALYGTRRGPRLPAATEIPSRRRPTSYSLNGVWTAYYRRGPGDYVWQDVELPSNWELLPGIENYAGSMRFTKVVRLPARRGAERVVVTFHGVDYFADLWVNGYHVGGHEGYFGPFEFDVTRYLWFGGHNLLRLAVTSPNDPSGSGTHVASGWDDFRPSSWFPNAKTLVKGTLGHHDAKRGGAWNSLTSQDGNTGGVWNDVELSVRNAVHFDRHGTRIVTHQLAPGPGGEVCSATVQMRFLVRNTSSRAAEGRVRVAVVPANFEGRAHRFSYMTALQPGSNEVVFNRTLSPLHPWAPWDQGFPHLYTVTAVLEVAGAAVDKATVETGFRVLSVTPLGESPGPDGAFIINGEPVFARGTNVLPTYWLSEYTPEWIERDLRLLRAAGFNAILIHNLVAPKRLYQFANRHGFMVVQMFPLQWSYDQSESFVSRASQQLREMAGLLYNEPSVVSYEVHNEPDMRTAPGRDNRFFDLDLHALLRSLDPYRWGTTYSGGNHAYPGQFYWLRDDNSFATLPATSPENEFHGRRVSRHRNMPTEFGIQAMPNVALFQSLMSEAAVRRILHRVRTDPKWIAAGGEPWDDAEAIVEAAKSTLGAGSWSRTLDALDWRLLWKMDDLREESRQLEQRGHGDRDREVVARQLALLLLDVLHYRGFKGENFWFGLWRPARSLEDFVRSSQDRQYRLHKDAIETYLNAGVTGPVVGYFSFMFRDPDREAPTWGVVDATEIPKKAYRAYLESNHPVRVTLPQALHGPVKLPGDRWFGGDGGERPEGGSARPWADADLIVANDSPVPIERAQVTLWLEDAAGRTVPFADRSGRERAAWWLELDLPARGGFDASDRLRPRNGEESPAEWTVSHQLPAGTYHLRAQVARSDGEALSTNSYEMLVPDLDFAWLGEMQQSDILTLLHGGTEAAGFHFWHHGGVVHRAEPGVLGLLAGVEHARAQGIDLYETTQGEHFFRHILAELAPLPAGRPLTEVIWVIRSEILSPAEKTRVLLRYLEIFAARAGGHVGPLEPESPRRIGGSR